MPWQVGYVEIAPHHGDRLWKGDDGGLGWRVYIEGDEPKTMSIKLAREEDARRCAAWLNRELGTNQTDAYQRYLEEFNGDLDYLFACMIAEALAW